jgi:hypothetical protein
MNRFYVGEWIVSNKLEKGFIEITWDGQLNFYDFNGKDLLIIPSFYELGEELGEFNPEKRDEVFDKYKESYHG